MHRPELDFDDADESLCFYRENVWISFYSGETQRWVDTYSVPTAVRHDEELAARVSRKRHLRPIQSTSSEIDNALRARQALEIVRAIEPGFDTAYPEPPRRSEASFFVETFTLEERGLRTTGSIRQKQSIRIFPT